jgi:hypothetical protein
MLVAATLMAVLVASSLNHFADSGTSDYFLLLESADAFVAGANPYEPPSGNPIGVGADMDSPNLNHPAVVLALAPFTAASMRAGLFTWTLLNVLAGIATALLVAREFHFEWTLRRTATVAGLAILAPGVGFSLQIGQMGLLFALPVAVLWILLRRERWITAGLVLGALAVLKPFLLPLFAIFLMRRRIAPFFAAGLSAAALSLATLPFVGLQGLRDWFGMLATVSWFDHSLNISLLGFIDRLLPGPHVSSSLALLVTLGVMLAAGGTLFLRGPAWLARLDRDFSVLLVAAILGSPLGWLYYTPLLAPVVALVAVSYGQFSAAGRRRIMLTAALLGVPFVLPQFFGPGIVGGLLGGVYTYGLVLTFLGLAGIVRLTAASPAMHNQVWPVPAYLAQEEAATA